MNSTTPSATSGTRFSTNGGGHETDRLQTRARDGAEGHWRSTNRDRNDVSILADEERLVELRALLSEDLQSKKAALNWQLHRAGRAMGTSGPDEAELTPRKACLRSAQRPQKSCAAEDISNDQKAASAAARRAPRSCTALNEAKMRLKKCCSASMFRLPNLRAGGGARLRDLEQVKTAPTPTP